MIERMLWKEHRPAQPIFNVSSVSSIGAIRARKLLISGWHSLVVFLLFVNQVFYYYKLTKTTGT